MLPEIFAELLSKNSAFEQLLDDAKELPKPSYITKDGCTNTYHYLLNLKPIIMNHRLSYALNAQGALEQFLNRRGIAYISTDKYRKLYELLLDAQPSWLDVDMEYFQTQVLALAPIDLKKVALKKWLREKLKELFKFVSKPPHWIQNPQWPIQDCRPLVFLGQFALKDYFHDNAAVYVFHNKESGECKTVIQVY